MRGADTAPTRKQLKNRRFFLKLTAMDGADWTEFDLVLGVDEAGRGARGGRGGGGACTHRPLLSSLGVADSKTLSPQRREEVAGLLRQHTAHIPHHALLVDVAEVENRNVLGASLWGMRQAALLLIQETGAQNPLVLVDGNQRLPDFPFSQQTCVKGDARFACIGAASILAKVTRDAFMTALDRDFPAYGFARHKGYGTAAHRQALLTHGPCPQHRSLFIRGIFQKNGAG